MIKTVSLLRAKAPMSREEFNRHWLEVHGSLSLSVPGIRRYVQNHIIEEKPSRPDIPALETQIDGFVEMWFDNMEEFKRANASPEIHRLRSDGPLFIGNIKAWVVDEKIIIDR